MQKKYFTAAGSDPCVCQWNLYQIILTCLHLILLYSQFEPIILNYKCMQAYFLVCDDSSSYAKFEDSVGLALQLKNEYILIIENVTRMNKAKNKNVRGKQLRKPISNNFAPKRLAINFDPPMIIIEYLVVDTGKLYHHKMRLDSILKRNKVSRDTVLNYLKTKHHLYFVSGKIKDNQLLKFIDKILLKKGLVTKAELAQMQQNTPVQPQTKAPLGSQQQDDFEYLNGEEEEEEEYYEEDYQDYEDTNYVAPTKQEAPKDKDTKKNAFMAYCQEYEEAEDGEAAQASWDLDMDQNDDFV